MDTAEMDPKEYLIYLKSRVHKFAFWIYAINIIGIPLLIPFIMCVFFSYSVDYGAISLVFIWLHYHIFCLCRDLKSDAVDRLERWKKIYEIIED